MISDALSWLPSLDFPISAILETAPAVFLPFAGVARVMLVALGASGPKKPRSWVPTLEQMSGGKIYELSVLLREL